VLILAAIAGCGRASPVPGSSLVSGGAASVVASTTESRGASSCALGVGHGGARSRVVCGTRYVERRAPPAVRRAEGEGRGDRNQVDDIAHSSRAASIRWARPCAALSHRSASTTMVILTGAWRGLARAVVGTCGHWPGEKPPLEAGRRARRLSADPQDKRARRLQVPTACGERDRLRDQRAREPMRPAPTDGRAVSRPRAMRWIWSLASSTSRAPERSRFRSSARPIAAGGASSMRFVRRCPC